MDDDELRGPRIGGLQRRVERVIADPNTAVLAMHTVLAVFVSASLGPATQDGPAHLYAVHILDSLARGRSIYGPFFSPNLHFAPNSLFSYVALALAGRLRSGHTASLVFLGILVAWPASAFAFRRALRGPAAGASRSPLPDLAATSLSCVLAYSYFLYRGLFNYAIGLPCAFGCIAATIASGDGRKALPRRIGFGLGALLLAVCAALAHTAAAAFLVAAMMALSIRANGARLTAAGVGAAVLTISLPSSVHAAGAGAASFSGPATAVMQIVRALGVSFTWLEVVPAVATLALVVWAAARAVRATRLADVGSAWPVALAIALLVLYFALPFEYGGLAGINERIPLFAAMLLVPYVPMAPVMRRALPFGFAVFAVYTAAVTGHFGARAREIRRDHAAALIPAGSVVYPISLDVKLGALSVDLGRHVLADVARQHDLVAPEVFCSHPAHVLRCSDVLPPTADLGAVQQFEHLADAERQHALSDGASPVRRSLDRMRHDAASAGYLLVLGAKELDPAFDRFVVQPLAAELLAPQGEPLRAYRLPRERQATGGR